MLNTEFQVFLGSWESALQRTCHGRPTSPLKKAQKHFLGKLKKAKFPCQVLVNLHTEEQWHEMCTARTGGLCSGWLKPPRTSLVPIYRSLVISVRWGACRAQRILKDSTHPDTACSPCCCLAGDAEVSAAVPPDYRAASFLRLRDF